EGRICLRQYLLECLSARVDLANAAAVSPIASQYSQIASRRPRARLGNNPPIWGGHVADGRAGRHGAPCPSPDARRRLESKGVQDQGAREYDAQDQSKQLRNLTLAHVQFPLKRLVARMILS